MIAVNPQVLWLTGRKSELITQVMQAMTCGCVVKELDSFLQCTALLEKVGEHGVAVMELTGVQDLPPPDVLMNLSMRWNHPLILVLLPKAIGHQTTAWLNAGADRCLPAETDIALIQAMIRSMLNRCCGQPATYTEHGLLRFEHDTNTLLHGNARVELTYKETLLTSLLLRNANRHIRRDELFQLLCVDGKRNSDPAVVYLYIHRLNKKLRGYGLRIVHKRGYGYRMRDDLPKERASKACDCPSPAQKLGNHLFDREIFRQTWLRI